jgi:hypothetical protein
LKTFVKRAEGGMRLLGFVATISLIALTLAGVDNAEENSVTWTGWFSDLKCASARAAAGTFSGTNPDCARSCIEKGAAPVFISEQAKAIFQVKDSSSVIEDLGYHIEVQATVDEATKMIRIQKVKRLAYQGAACARPKKSSEK